MKIALVSFVLAYCSSVFGLDISYPEPRLIESDEAWKYGIKQATKDLENNKYLSITINPRLLCEVEKIESTAWLYNQIGHELDVLKAAEAFTVNFDKRKYSRVEFLILCREESKIHRGYFFKYIAWESPIA